MTAPYLILAIVEGHGEQKAVPLLLRRWFQHRRFRNFETRDLAIRIEYYVEMAARERPDGILVVLDADDECQERAKDRRRLGLGPELLQQKRWEKAISDIESIRDCKKPLAYLLGRPYEETTDQTDFTGALPFTATMARRSRSYRKLMTALQALTQAARTKRRTRALVSPRP